MSITNTFPYVSLRTYHNISDEELARCTFDDLAILDTRVGLNTVSDKAAEIGYGEFISIERQELIDSLSYDQFEKAAMESFKDEYDQSYSLMGLFLRSYFGHLHTKRKHQRWIDEDRYEDKPEERLIVDRLLNQDEKTFRSIGTIDVNDAYPVATKEQYIHWSDSYESHKQRRDYMVSKYPNVSRNFPAA